MALKEKSMVNDKREKSKKYPGVYWRAVSETNEKTFYIRYRLGGRGSKEIEEPVGKSSAGMTEAKANQIRALRMAGKSKPNTTTRAEEKAAKDAKANRWTVSLIWTAYDEAHKKRSCAKQDLSYTQHLLPELGEKIPAQLVSLDIERLRYNLSKKKSTRSDNYLSTQTQKHVLALLKRILRWATEMGHIEPPSHLKFKMPTVDNKKTEFMNEQQLQLYLKALDEEEDQDKAAFFRILLLTGIRRTALLNVQWTDVDLKKGFLTLRGATAKNEKTQTIPISPGAIAILRKITPDNSSDYIWPGHDGRPREDFRRMGRRLRDKAGLPKTFRPCHGLRHHYASSLACSGQVDLYKLQKLLTHGSATMTQRYAHLTDEALRRAASVADGILNHVTSYHKITIDEDV